MYLHIFRRIFFITLYNYFTGYFSTLLRLQKIFIFYLQKVAPKIAPFDFGEEPLNYGEPASIQCTILGGDLPINVTWLLNNATIDRYHDISFSRIGKRINVLSIESVAAHHAGFYSCHAQNKAGITAHTARLIVNGLLIFFF